MAPKKIDAMMHLLKEPKARELLCGIIGMVNYYTAIYGYTVRMYLHHF